MPWWIITVLPFAIIMTWSSNINEFPECAEWEEITITEHDCWTHGVDICGPTITKARKCKEWIPAE